MSRFTTGALAICLQIALLGADTPIASADAPGTVAKRAGTRVNTGQEVFEHVCQGCHMPGGQGATGAGTYPKLAQNAALASWQYVATMVLNGRAGMPAFGRAKDAAISGPGGAYLTDIQIAAVVNFVRTHFGNRYRDSVSAAQIESLPHTSEKQPDE